eukprot:4734597-Pyramimonas_sp.AAC.1
MEAQIARDAGAAADGALRDEIWTLPQVPAAEVRGAADQQLLDDLIALRDHVDATTASLLCENATATS